MNKRKMFPQKIAFLLLTILMVLSMSLAAIAADSIPMKKTKVKWDLKPNRTYRVKTKYCGVGMQRFDIKISNFKKKRQGNVMTVSFDILYDAQVFRPTPNQVHKMIRSMQSMDLDEDVGGYVECYIVDYTNGRNLEWEDNDDEDDEWEWDPETAFYEQYGYVDEDEEDDSAYTYDDWADDLRDNPEIDITWSRRKKYKNLTYRDAHGCHVWLTKEIYHATIKCPRNYKNLCIGIGGCSTIIRNVTEEKFRFGAVPFARLTDYKKAPKNWHFMRVK